MGSYESYESNQIEFLWISDIKKNWYKTRTTLGIRLRIVAETKMVAENKDRERIYCGENSKDSG